MREPVRVREVRRLKSQGAGIPIHLLDEVLHRLIRRYPPLVHIVLAVTSVVLVVLALTVRVLRVLVLVFFLGVNRTTAYGRRAGLPRLTVLFVIFVPGSYLKKVLAKMLG